MLSFLARTFLLLAAAFGLGAIGGGATRRRGGKGDGDRRVPVSAEPAGSPAQRPPNLRETSDAIIAGAIAGETGSDVGGNNLLAEFPANRAPSASSPSPAAPTETPPIATTGDLDAETSAPRIVGEIAMTGEAPQGEPLAAFASYGGSGVSAGVERMDAAASAEGLELPPTETTPSRHSRWSESTSPRAPEDRIGFAAPSLADADPRPLGAPDPHGRTPSLEDRRRLADDSLLAKHESASFDDDVKSVDFSRLGPSGDHRPTAGVMAEDDGWTVPEEAPIAGEEVVETSASVFKSSGGSAPLRGAPETAVEDAAPDMVAENVATPADGPARADMPAGTGDRPDEPEAIDPPDPASTTGVSSVPADATPAATPLAAPRGGTPDNLTRISGIGPSIERLLFANGVFHFEQIAAWTEVEARWADDLTGFRGRVVRERWIEQSRAFAAEGAAD